MIGVSIAHENSVIGVSSVCLDTNMIITYSYVLVYLCVECTSSVKLSHARIVQVFLH